MRNFDLEFTKERSGNQMRIKGFYSFDEAHAYEQQLMADSAFIAVARSAEPIIISDQNLQLINIRYTWGQYKDFYEKYYVPDKVKPELKLDQQPDNFIWDEFEEVDDTKTPVNTEGDDDEYYDDDDDEWY